MRRVFYFAAPYNLRLEGLQHADEIERRSGWRCNSRWLTGEHDGQADRVCALDDLADVRDASAVVMFVPRQSTRGGVWVELGYALALGIPVLLACSITPNVFAAAPGVHRVDDLGVAAARLRSMMPPEADPCEG